MFARRSFAVVLGAAAWSVALGASATPATLVQVTSTAPAPGLISTASTALPAGGASPPQPSAPAPETKKPLDKNERARALRGVTLQLDSTDPGVIQQGLDALRELGGRDAADTLIARLRAGLPPQLAEAALDTLGVLGQPSATPVLVELTLHRRWQIREKAVAALGALGARGTASVLLYALDDPSAEVRAAAARALGQVGDVRALPALSVACEKGVDGALLALAQLGGPKQLELILGRAKQDVRASEPALRALLLRRNLPLSSKLQIVSALRALDTPDAQAVVTNLRGSLGKEADPRVVHALEAQGAKP